ncbi:MAG: NAD(P)-dependent oxidoreductase [Lentisphaerae bacterium]|nr:NAD(P)-dependent oxidoreductase [Lentisphaerota bacterium]
MKFVITGANGFIGSYMAWFLLQRGHHVIALSRRFHADVKRKLDGAVFIEQDVRDPALASLRVTADAVIHLATPNDIVSKRIADGVELSVMGTVNTLGLAARNGVGRYVFFSTLQVYGTELSGNYSENSPVKPENDYAMNHLFGEMYAEIFSRKTDIRALIVRPSNIYGPFVSRDIQRWTLVPGCFCREAAEKGTITLLSSGRQYRNFISLDACCAAVGATVSRLTERYDVLNLVSNEYLRIIDVARVVADVMKKDFGRDAEIIVKSDLPVESNVFRVSAEALRRYEAEVNPPAANLRTGIRAVCEMLLMAGS